MAYISLYRKYRSQSFGEVIGQDHVTTVLRNAIRMGRIAHAYLFCGPRGCGKTSTARLLARALNCIGEDGARTSANPEPCGMCSLCKSIRDGSAMDVIEMDAASETGIDDVREKIIENAKFAPGEARFKVYIIDEVHDLSQKAFDSLLKTIEEPPAHVIFILATTEAHKVPITVRSRCQRMDFRRGVLSDLNDNIRRVLDQEQIEYDSEAVAAIARAAEGSFRDSLSLLEQALAYSDSGRLTAEAVHASIGTVGSEVLDDITRTLASDDPYAVFLKAGSLLDSGKDVKQTLIALQGHLRDLLVAAMAATPQALSDVSPERFAQLREQSAAFSPQQLLKMLDSLAEAERNLRFTNQHQRVLEVALWSILPRHLVTASDVGDAAGKQPGQQRSPARPAPSEISAGSKPEGAQPGPASKEAGRTADIDAQSPAEVSPDTQLDSSRAVTPSLPSEIESAVGPDRFAQSIDLEGIRRIWPRVVRRLLQRSKYAAAYFGSEEIVRLDRNILYIGFPNEFSRGGADKPKGRELVENVLAEELGIAGWKIKCVLQDEKPRDAPGPITGGAQIGLDESSLQSSALVQEAPSPNLLETASFEATEVMNGSADADMPLFALQVDSAEEDERFLQLVKQEFDGKDLDE